MKYWPKSYACTCCQVEHREGCEKTIVHLPPDLERRLIEKYGTLEQPTSGEARA